MLPQWKMQRYNNGCFPTCIAMLLSSFGIDKEDYDIVEEAQLPYMLGYSSKEDKIYAGIFYPNLNPDIFELVLAPHGLILINSLYSSFTEYKKELMTLMDNNSCAVSSLPYSKIPSPLYKNDGRNNNHSGHAVVLYKLDGDTASFFDPSGGVDRNRDWKYDEVRQFVDLKISLSSLEDALSERNTFPLGHLERTEKPSRENLIKSYQNIAAESLLILPVFKTKCDELAATAETAAGRINHELFMSYISKYIKPVILDWRTAIEMKRVKSDAAKILINSMKEFQLFIITEQKSLKTSGSVSRDFSGKLTGKCDSFIKECETYLAEYNPDNSIWKDTP